MPLKQTPSQTIGPYFAYGLTAQQYHYPLSQIAGSRLATDQTAGERIRIVGTVFDGAGDIDDDQADAVGADVNRGEAGDAFGCAPVERWCGGLCHAVSLRC